MSYDLPTDLIGIVARHAAECPARIGSACSCGPLGYSARIWDWDSARWAQSPLLGSIAAARSWQRDANQLADGLAAAPEVADDEADPSEKLFWWAFWYVALGFVGVAVALFASDIAG